MKKVSAATVESQIRDTLINWELHKGAVKKMTVPEGAVYSGEDSREFSTITYKGYRYEIPYTCEMPLYSGGGIYDETMPLHEGKVSEIPSGIAKDFRRLVLKFFENRGFKSYWYWDKGVSLKDGSIWKILDKLTESNLQYPINLEKVLPVKEFEIIVQKYWSCTCVTVKWPIARVHLVFDKNGKINRIGHVGFDYMYKNSNLSTVIPVIKDIIDQKDIILKNRESLGNYCIKTNFSKKSDSNKLKVVGVKANDGDLIKPFKLMVTSE